MFTLIEHGEVYAPDPLGVRAAARRGPLPALILEHDVPIDRLYPTHVNRD